ncbi:MAG: phosphate ABC transporter ATP-binding protein [Chloroflexota bacterium]
MPNPYLTVRSLTYSFRQKAILHGVTFDAQRGKLTALVGPSGSGKSTVLRLINRLLEPPPNSILLAGDDVVARPPNELRLAIGMVFQRPYLFPGTVGENVRYGLNLRGEQLSNDETAGWLERVSLPAEWINKPVDVLSGGETQRLALARALANRPELLLLDEPTSALDPRATHIIEEVVLNACREQQLSALWVSHDPDQISRISEDIVFIKDGIIAAASPADELLEGNSREFQLFMTGEIR